MSAANRLTVRNFLHSIVRCRNQSPPSLLSWLSLASRSSRSNNDVRFLSTTDHGTRMSASIHRLPPQFLRASDASNYDPVSLQRNDVAFNVESGKPAIKNHHRDDDDDDDRKDHDLAMYRIQRLEYNGEIHRIHWEDGHISEFSNDWVQTQIDNWMGTSPENRTLWSGLTEDTLRSSSTMTIHFKDLLSSDGMSFGIRALYQFGILLVTNTPVDNGGAAISAMASSLGGGTIKNAATMLHSFRSGSSDIMLPHGTDGPLRTLYGTVWSTTSSGQASGASIADSAYSQESLPLHTDMTYMRDPPGLQIFSMVQPALEGGESIFGDGFAVAEKVRAIDPEAFATLANTRRRYRSVDLATGWHLEARGPVISLYNDQIIGIRHNDLDRLPDLPPTGSTTEERDIFYQQLKAAHETWDTVLGADDMRLELKLQKGDTIVVANQVSASS